MSTNHTPTRPSPTQELSRLTARVAALEAALREIGDAMESDDDYNGAAAERYRTAARAALAKS